MRNSSARSGPAMREYLIAFLQALETALPPPPNHHHAIVIDHFGRLALWIEGREMAVWIDEGDLDKPVEQLVRECCAVVIGKDVMNG
jgi:hypothetical protein